MRAAAVTRALAGDRPLGALWRTLLFIALYSVLLVLLQPVALLLPGGGGEAAALTLYGAVMLLAGLLAGFALLRWLDGRRAGALGFAIGAHAGRELAAGLAAGVLAMLLAAALLAVTGLLRFAPDDGTTQLWVQSTFAALLTFTVAAAAEEVVYRGYAFQALVRGFGPWPTLLVTSALFALAHARNPAITSAALLNIFLAGIVLGLTYLRTLSLWAATALHVGWNWSMASLLDLPVSGLTMVDTPLYEPIVGGARWLSGREFGPEGGLVGTVGLCAALLVIFLWPRLEPSAPQCAARPLPLERTRWKQAGPAPPAMKDNEVVDE
jgi:hypothetical protein